jgi:hypothetical protein
VFRVVEEGCHALEEKVRKLRKAALELKHKEV